MPPRSDKPLDCSAGNFVGQTPPRGASLRAGLPGTSDVQEKPSSEVETKGGINVKVKAVLNRRRRMYRYQSSWEVPIAELCG